MRIKMLVLALLASSIVAPAAASPALAGGTAGSAGGANLAIAPASGPPGSSVTAKGQGFTPGEMVSIAFDGGSLQSVLADGNGVARAMVNVPRAATPGPHSFGATGETSGNTAEAAFTVHTDWPQFRFNAARTGRQQFENVLSASNVPQLQIDWQAQLGDIVNSSSPAVVDGVVYIGSTDGRLWAYPEDGCGQSLCTTPLWQSTNLWQVIDSPTVADGLVFVGSQTSATSNDGKLNVFSAAGCGQAECQPLWQGRAGPDSILDSSPAVAGGFVYVAAFDGKLYVFDEDGCGRKTCDPVWTAATGRSSESSPTVVGGVVYLGSDDGNLYAFDAAGCGAATCGPLWRGSIGGPAFSSSAAVANGTVFIGSAHFLSAFPAAGCGSSVCQPLWRGANGADFVNGSPAVSGGLVYIGLENGVGVWSTAGCGQADCPPSFTLFGSGAQAAVLSSPTVANGVVYAGRNTGEVLAWRATCTHPTCSEIWKGFTRNVIVTSSPTVVNGKLYIGSADDSFPPEIKGRLYVFALRS